MKQIPTNAPNGVAFTITTHLNQTGATNLVSGGGWYPSTGVIVITDNEKADMLQQGRDGGEVHTKHRESCRHGQHVKTQGPAALPRSDSDI